MRLIITVVLVYLFAGTAFAAESPRIFHFDKKTYQAHYQNWSITQSTEGILFFGNTDGLLEYDGSSWAMHMLPANQTVRTAAQGKEGLIYTGGYEEFGYWKRDAWGKLRYHSLSAHLRHNTLQQQEIWHILATDQGIFFQSFGVLFHYDQHRVRQIPVPSTIMFLHEINGQILAPVIGKGIYSLNPDQSWSLLPGSEVFSNKTITVLLPDAGGMLVGTQESGFYRYDGQRFVFWSHPLNAELADNQVNKAIRMRDGRIAVGTILNGVYILSPEHTKVLHFNRVKNLQNNTILALFEDRDGNLWLGLDKGIDMIAFSDPFEYYEDTQGQFGTVYTAAVYEGYLYIGANQGLFCKPFPGNAPFKLIPGTQGQVWQLRVLDGQLLCGHNQGTFRIKDRKAYNISPVTGGWQLIEWPGPPELLLQGTYTGIAAFTKNADGLWQLKKKLPGLTNPIQKLISDHTGVLWAVDPYEGVFRIRLAADGLKILHIDTINTQSGLPADYNLDLLLLDKAPLIWSVDRYYHWDARTRKCIPYRPSNQEVLPEQNGKLIRMPNGDQFQIFAQRTAWYSSKGFKAWLPISLVRNNEQIESIPGNRYLFCLDNGYALLDQDMPIPSTSTTRPLIRMIQPLRYGQPLEGNHRDAKPTSTYLTLPARSASFIARFAIPLFTQTPEFRYRIPGWQDEWSPWSVHPFKEFADLPAGIHRLEVACNLSTDLAAVTIYVQPQWYQTWWAISFFFLLTTALITLLLRLHRVRLQLQRRRLLLEKERQLHDQRLQARAEQLQADVLNKSQELANSTFNLIRKNETLLQIKEALGKVKTDLGDRLPDKYHSRLLRIIDSHLGNEQDWQIFETNFNQVHEVFLNKLKTNFPDLTPGDLRLAAYLKMNLASKEIAPLLNISLRGVENKRYRLRQKLHLDNDANLTEFLMQYA